MHPTLQRQIKKFLSEMQTPINGWDDFIKSISDAYYHHDQDRKLIERSLELSSKELTENNQQLQVLLADSKRLEIELKKEKENVEKKVLERTQQLQYEEARLQASINSLSIGYIMTDVNNALVIINDAAKDIFTLTISSAAVTQKAIDTSHLRNTIDLTFIQNALKGKVDLMAQMETVKIKKQNIILKNIPYKLLFLNLYLTPIINKAADEVIGTVILVEDITEQKVLERSRNEFFSIASHELRTPLTAIRGNTSLIKDYYIAEVTNPIVRESIDDIHQSSIRLIQIVNDFLDVSRIDQGRLQFFNEAFDVVTLADDVLKEYDVTGSRKKLYLRVVRPDKPLPLVYADRDRVRQVIVNLVGNGIKFTERGGVIIMFSQSHTQVGIFVTDTGMGIPEENRNLLFRKFQQAESNILTRDATKGTGLGLYIAKVFMKEMGGSIDLLKSEIGKGSTFRVTIPIATAAQIALGKEAHA